MSDALIETGCEPSRCSLFLMEGLAMYLDVTSVDASFAAIVDLAGTNCGLTGSTHLVSLS